MPGWLIPAILAAVVVGGGAVVAGYELGKSSSHGTSPTATPVVSPTPTTSPTPGPSATPSASATPTPVSTPGATVTPGSTSTPAQLRSIQAAAIRAKSYNPRAWYYSLINGGGSVWAWKATCAGSAEHYCQNVFFFHGATMLGTDTSKPSRDILRITPLNGASFAVKYANYAAGDADCCPSGKPVTITYTWNGTSMSASGTPPGQ